MVYKDLQSIQNARDLVEAAYRAQLILSTFDQARIDVICDAMAEAVRRESMRLAQLAHQETGFGNPTDKNIKNLFCAVDVHNYFKGLRTVGIVRESESIVEIASPRGVVAAIVPSTNPTSTAIFKILISIKSRNAVVLSPHPSASQCVIETVRVMREAAIKAGLPNDAIGCLGPTTVEGTHELMKHRLTAVILATGGTGLVRAAYSSGKPAFGVGPGNVPAFIEKTADVAKAVKDILSGKCFDYGTICASEQAVIADSSIDAEVRLQFSAQGAYFLNQSQADSLARIIVSPRGINAKIVGKPATLIAEWAGITVPSNTRCLIAEVGGVGRDFPLSMEKLSPILAYYTANGTDEGSSLCNKILNYGGLGHTAAIHTRDRNAAVKFGMMMPVARITVNTPSTHGAIGFSTALSPSMTLGCGSWGGNATSDNISPLHLMDIKRVAFETKPVVVSNYPDAPAKQMNSASTRELITNLVDTFLASRKPEPEIVNVEPIRTQSEEPKTKVIKIEALPITSPSSSINGHKAVDFVCEDDVRRAVTAGDKIYVNSKTIITPAARDLGDSKDIFARI